MNCLLNFPVSPAHAVWRFLRYLPGLALLTSLAVQAAPEKLVIDPGHTFPVFEVRHLGIATQRGRFNKTTGTVELDAEAGTGRAEIRIDARSVSTGNEELDALLRGAFYFAVVDHPEILYTASAVRFEDGKPVRVEGELRFLGVTRPLVLAVSGYGCIRFPVLRCGADLSARFRRSDFGLVAMANFVGDEVSMLIQAEMVRP
jgi:polyisoprenoid-binding protein YceI